MSGEERKDSSLTIDRAAFLLLRVKRVFRKKKQQRKEQKAAEIAAAAAATKPVVPPGARAPPPLLRSRTLPAIVVPGISILQAQIDSKHKEASHHAPSSPQFLSPRFSFADTNTLDPRRHLAHHRLSSPETCSSDMLTLPSQAPRLSTGSAGATLGRLAKLLNQRGGGGDSTPRRLSWETDSEEASTFIPRSSSIDSMVSVGVKRCNPLSRRIPSPLLVPRPPDRPPPLSPSVARRLKGQRAVNGSFYSIDEFMAHDWENT